MQLDNLLIPGHHLVLRFTARMQTQDQTGKLTSTQSSFEGFKAKRIEGRFFLRTEEMPLLTTFLSLFEALENGSPKVWRVLDPTANALGIQQARFEGNLNVDPVDRLQQWQISFTLLEIESTPERQKERSPSNTPLVTEASLQESLVTTVKRLDVNTP